MKNISRYLLACIFCISLGCLNSAQAKTPGPSCKQQDGVIFWTSPRTLSPGRPLGILAVTDEAPFDELAITDPRDRALSINTSSRGGPPWSLEARIERTEMGSYRIEARRKGATVSCQEIAVTGGAGTNGMADFDRAWDQNAEALYSTWIERLFDSPPEQDLSYPALSPVLLDPQRNFLYNYLGEHEDDALPATPDCADLPYFLRAYFAWKMGLPVGFRSCARADANSPPRCNGITLRENSSPDAGSLSGFRSFSQQVMDTVHSGNGRTALNDNATDFYPVELRRDALRPGTIFADPYGHLLIIAKWIPQSADRGGLLLAVDAQPDNSVTRKRFWEGTFLFADDVPGAGAGFKAFRPLARGNDGSLQPLSNYALADDKRFAPYSIKQANLAPTDFYAQMGKLINPQGLDPKQAYEDTLDALVEQLETRVKSVDNGEEYLQGHRGMVVPMPQGAAIFQTSGPWEDYATPSRDFRLIIAMKVLLNLPERIVRYPELFVLNGRSPSAARAEVEKLHQRRSQERTITYTRSNGNPWKLTVGEILARKSAYEMTYNPNDCVEVRWGARPGTEEYATCGRHAPTEQLARMEDYRMWFREGRRPSQ
jgi:hypothetical protein